MMWVMDEGRSGRTIISIGGLLGGPNLWPLLAAALGLGALIEAFAYASPSDRATAMVANVAIAIPLAFAFRWRLWAAVAVTVLMMIPLSGAVVITGSAVVAQLVALFLVAESFGPLVSAPFAVPYLLNVFFNWSGGAPGFSDLLPFVLVFAAIALGSLWRLRDRAIAERDESRREAADSWRERAAMEERARIARELHDVAAHHISKIAIQAEVGRVADPTVSEEERARLGEIGDTAREAMSEMRRVLGVLREDAGGEAERAPQPGLADLEVLIVDARQSGSPVRFSLSGQVVPLAPGVDLTAYRIVQEALTNIARHADATSAVVRLRYAADDLCIEIDDDGHATDGRAPAPGHGIRGMQERARALGGELSAGPAPEAGFRVRARLPIGGTA